MGVPPAHGLARAQEPHRLTSMEGRRPVLRNPYLWGFVVGAVLVTLSVPLLRRVPPAPAPIGVVPAWTLTDSTGARVGSAALAGRTHVLVLLDASCTTTCARTEGAVARAVRSFAEMGADVPVVTIDVGGADATALRALLASHGAPRGWIAAGGSAEQACALARGSFAAVRGIAVPCERMHDLAHSARALVVDGQGRIRASIDLEGDGEELLHRSLAVLEDRPMASTGAQ